MRKSQEGRSVASRVASRLHKQLEKLPRQQGMLRKQPASNSRAATQQRELRRQASSASSVACATIDGAHAPCSRISPKLKARSGIS
ncbi:hypothetical protein PIB30_069865, partial [Stylosanthes scabra]|nr:hypothetical protein [Stylosanthes scabra]